MKPVIHYDSLLGTVLMPHWAKGMVIGHHVFFKVKREKVTARDMLHELKHVEQFDKYGFWTFLLMYWAETLKVGYWNNKYEVEARRAEDAVMAE